MIAETNGFDGKAYSVLLSLVDGEKGNKSTANPVLNYYLASQSSELSLLMLVMAVLEGGGWEVRNASWFIHRMQTPMAGWRASTGIFRTL